MYNVVKNKQKKINMFIYKIDRTEKHDFWPQLLSFSSPFFFPPKKERRWKGEWISKNRNQMSCLSAGSIKSI